MPVVRGTTLWVAEPVRPTTKGYIPVLEFDD